MPIRYKWCSSIEDIGKNEWDSLNKSESILKSFDFSNAVEQSKLDGVNFYYLVVYKENKIISIFPCYSYRIKLEILAGNSIKKFTERVRKFYSGFLQTKLFVVGSPVATCENHIFINEADQVNTDEVFDLIMEKSNELKTPLVIVKEIPGNELSFFKKNFPKFYIFESLANSFVPISKDKNPYPGLLKKRYKQRFNKALKDSDKDGYQWEITKDFSLMSNQVHELYVNVFDKSDNKFELLTPDFFQKVNEHLPNNSQILICKDKSGKVICTELIIEGKHELIPMYLGLDYKYIENGNIYNNVIFRTFLEAEKRDKRWVVLGQTSYQTKAYCGAMFERLYLGVYSHKPVLKFFIKNFFKYLFPKFTKPEVNSFSENIKSTDYFKDILLNSNKKFE